MYIKNLHVDSKPFYVSQLIKKEDTFQWYRWTRQIVQRKKIKSQDTILAGPDTKHHFHVQVEASLTGVGSILVQEFQTGMRIVSFNSRVCTKN